MFKHILNAKIGKYQAFIRQKMLEDQIIRRGVKDGMVLEAMEKVKRHVFVDDYLKTRAYEDQPLPIAEGQTVSQPYIVALMTELLALKGGERVLEIGTGSGYQTAVLAELAGEVYTVEFFPALAEKAKAVLAFESYSKIRFRTGDGAAGWPENAPFDAIIVTCAPLEAPETLLSQLADKGRMVVPVGEAGGAQRLMLYTKDGADIKERFITEVRFVPMLANNR
ncbi:MAG: protein-L-isoaspartate O-methyltransferase [Elusimicrobia bacterium RIFOXYA12_FULL_51_18]|nr:MAG: protein-L-isoaspartate O-methyltransferase [Elusimicrobia bacterium RIFOXYA12_FULL_51_18]OGS28980.1 MAG: protein-L-isoaspartate O-methyltransferase [Elusimicrobia bacterium RIFOXYA2_FULL_53_38]